MGSDPNANQDHDVDGNGKDAGGTAEAKQDTGAVACHPPTLTGSSNASRAGAPADDDEFEEYREVVIAWNKAMLTSLGIDKGPAVAKASSKPKSAKKQRGGVKRKPKQKQSRAEAAVDGMDGEKDASDAGVATNTVNSAESKSVVSQVMKTTLTYGLYHSIPSSRFCKRASTLAAFSRADAPSRILQPCSARRSAGARC